MKPIGRRLLKTCMTRSMHFSLRGTIAALTQGTDLTLVFGNMRKMIDAKWERLEDPWPEDLETYGEGVEVWELWDYSGEGEVIQTQFITKKEDDDA